MVKIKITDRQLIEYQQNYGITGSDQPETINPQLNTKLLENTFYLFNGAFYKWDFSNNKWLNSDTNVYAYVDYMTGISYEWSQEENQWKAKPQNEATTQAQEPKPAEPQVIKDKDKKKKEGWFQIDDEKNTNVYVSGLPLDITDEEFEEMMSKYGIIMKDPLTHKLKLKLYRENDEVKGDGRCCYLMVQ